MRLRVVHERPPGPRQRHPAPRKLGFAPGLRAAFVDAPDGFAALLGELPDGVRVLARPRPGTDLVVAFVTARRALARRLPGLRRAIEPDGALWVGLAQARLRGGHRRHRGRRARRGAATGLVDVKVCAIDATWSGLKLVVRRELR